MDAAIVLILERIATALERMAPPPTVPARLAPEPASAPDPLAVATKAVLDMPSDDLGPTATPTATKAEAASALNALARLHGTTAGKGVLSGLGLTGLADLSPEQYGQVVATSRGLM